MTDIEEFTTRDVIEGMSITGVPLKKLIDTAGIREADDLVRTSELSALKKYCRKPTWSS